MSITPNNRRTALDKINEAKARVLRKMTDKRIGRIGTAIDLIRVRTGSDDEFANRGTDVYGFSAPKYNFQVISNCILVYPFPETEIFDVVNEAGLVNTRAFDMNEFLPIKLYLPHDGIFKEDPTAIKSGDILVDVKRDAKNYPIPVLLSVTTARGTFAGKYLARRFVDLSLVRAVPDLELIQVIRNYIDKVR